MLSPQTWRKTLDTRKKNILFLVVFSQNKNCNKWICSDQETLCTQMIHRVLIFIVCVKDRGHMVNGSPVLWNTLSYGLVMFNLLCAFSQAFSTRGCDEITKCLERLSTVNPYFVDIDRTESFTLLFTQCIVSEQAQLYRKMLNGLICCDIHKVRNFLWKTEIWNTWYIPT